MAYHVKEPCALGESPRFTRSNTMPQPAPRLGHLPFSESFQHGVRLSSIPPKTRKFQNRQLSVLKFVPSVGIEPTLQDPQSCVLSIERRGLGLINLYNKNPKISTSGKSDRRVNPDTQSPEDACSENAGSLPCARWDIKFLDTRQVGACAGLPAPTVRLLCCPGGVWRSRTAVHRGRPFYCL